MTLLAISGWCFAVVSWTIIALTRRSHRRVIRRLDELTRAADEIDEGPDPKPKPVSFTLDPGQVEIKAVGRYRNPGRRR